MTKFEDLTIQNNFLFQQVMKNPRICKRLIEELLNIKIAELSYPYAEKLFSPASTAAASGSTSSSPTRTARITI